MNAILVQPSIRAGAWQSRCFSSWLREALHARAGDDKTRAARQATGEGPDDASWRVRPRGNASHPRRKARGEFDEAGDRNRALESAESRRQAGTAAGRREGDDEAQCTVGEQSGREGLEASVGTAVACDPPRVEAEGTSCGVTQSSG